MAYVEIENIMTKRAIEKAKISHVKVIKLTIDLYDLIIKLDPDEIIYEDFYKNVIECKKTMSRKKAKSYSRSISLYYREKNEELFKDKNRLELGKMLFKFYDEKGETIKKLAEYFNLEFKDALYKVIELTEDPRAVELIKDRLRE